MFPEIVFKCPDCDKTETFSVDSHEKIWGLVYQITSGGIPMCIDCDMDMVLQETETENV